LPEEPKATLPAADGTRIRIRLDRRASGRVVTVVSGLPGSASGVADLARDLKTACGTGGTSHGSTLELQGDQRERVEAALAARGLGSKRAGG
jgi:translation initiation factor 1